MKKKYIVELTKEESSYLKKITSKGKSPAYKIKHANILLLANIKGSAMSDKEIANIVHCHLNTVSNIRKSFVEQGFECALNRKKQKEPSRKPLLDGEKEAMLTIACSKPPKGHNKWTLKMLADELVYLEVVDSISDQTVRRTLKKTNYAPTHLRFG